MPYTYKKEGDKYVVYKKTGKRVGATKGTKPALKKYLAALHMHEMKIKENMKSNRSIKLADLIREFLNENSSYEEFDNINNSVWRKLADKGNYNDAINYMNNYLNNNKFNLEEYQIGGILWHIGQLYAFKGDYKKAIKFMSMKNVSDSIEPNYQKGTISYLSRDFKELQKYYNSLAKKDPTGGSGRDILKKFIDNFDKPYKEIY